MNIQKQMRMLELLLINTAPLIIVMNFCQSDWINLMTCVPSIEIVFSVEDVKVILVGCWVLQGAENAQISCYLPLF